MCEIDFRWHIVALNPGQSIRPIQTQHHTKFTTNQRWSRIPNLHPAFPCICDGAFIDSAMLRGPLFDGKFGDS